MDRRVLLSKRMLQEAIISILKKKNLSEISVLELCEKANVNRTTFYKYYRDISDLLNEIKEELLSDLTKILIKYDMRKENEIAISKIMQLLKEKEKYAKVLLGEHVNQSFLDDLYPYFIEKSYTDKTSGRNPRMQEGYFIILYYGSIGLIRKWVNDDLDLQVSEVAKIIKDISNYYYGIE